MVADFSVYRQSAGDALLPDGQALADLLSEFARTMLTDFAIQKILDQLVRRIVEILPVSSAGVTLIPPPAAPRYIAASDDAALRYEQLQTDLNEGPCLLAVAHGEAVQVPDLRTETRFPQFVRAASAAGLGAVFTFPLTRDGHRLGALNLYRDLPGGMSAKTLSAAQTLADVVTAYLVNAQARSELEDASDRSRRAALHDPLTGLPNRVLLLERMEHALLRSARSQRASAVLFIDLDHFKTVNDRYGHEVGDNLLQQVAGRLRHLMRPGDTLARLSGDEFVIICEDLAAVKHATGIGARLAEGMNVPFVLNGTSVTVTASIGIAYTSHDDGENFLPKQLLHEADMAMYQAKRNGGHCVVFQPPHEPLTTLEQDLRLALEHGELDLHYQPILTAAGGEIRGFEALLRWRHPTRGLIPPSTFIPLAEKSGLIIAIGQWVLQRAWSDRDLWQQQVADRDLEMSVNVSAHQLTAPHFVEQVAGVLAGVDAPPRLLTLEITESVFLKDAELALTVLHQLKDLGVRLALDDIGTGYSSLSYLRRFPIDIIKIDRIFVADLIHDKVSHTIVTAVIQLAHGLGMTVVAEGVETQQQHQQVSDLDCDYCQGFHFAAPAPAEEIPTLLGAKLPPPTFTG